MGSVSTLALNCGSSSLKFGMYRAEGDDAELLWEGEAEEIGRESSSFWLKAVNAEKETRKVPISDHGAALLHVFKAMAEFDSPDISAVGHRFVHGGPRLRNHQRITTELRRQLQAAVEYAPLHLPAAISVLEEVSKRLPDVPQIACFDTAFHSEMPDISKTFALPLNLRASGIERYGFHGLSLESIV